MKNSVIRISIITVVLLLIPLAAMQFTDEVAWDVADFIIAGFLILVTGLTFEVIMSKLKSIKQRVIVGAVIGITFLLLWAELAVGIFNSPIAGS